MLWSSFTLECNYQSLQALCHPLLWELHAMPSTAVGTARYSTPSTDLDCTLQAIAHTGWEGGLQKAPHDACWKRLTLFAPIAGYKQMTRTRKADTK